MAAWTRLLAPEAPFVSRIPPNLLQAPLTTTSGFASLNRFWHSCDLVVTRSNPAPLSSSLALMHSSAVQSWSTAPLAVSSPLDARMLPPAAGAEAAAAAVTTPATAPRYRVFCPTLRPGCLPVPLPAVRRRKSQPHGFWRRELRVFLRQKQPATAHVHTRMYCCVCAIRLNTQSIHPSYRSVFVRAKRASSRYGKR